MSEESSPHTDSMPEIHRLLAEGAGLELLRRPILPLVRLLPLLYLTGPFSSMEELLEQLKEPIETGGVTYPNPDRLLEPHLETLRLFTRLKGEADTNGLPEILDERGGKLSGIEALELMVCQSIMEAELESINSLLCSPCRCSLCCTGPTPEMKQEFFEIPLQKEERGLFELKEVNTPRSRRSNSGDEPPLTVDHTPFYTAPPALYHWQSGWSMILPRAASCPQLNRTGGCKIYPQRPRVCRRPQIFAYLLEEENPKTLRAPNKVLAVWECPYVRALKDEIIHYATTSGVEPVFRTNKH